MDTALTRRQVLGALGVGVASVAGCQAPGGISDTDESSETEAEGPATQGTPGDQTPLDEHSVYTDVYRSVADAVVSIRVQASGGRDSQGSGFLVSDRYIVTNQHVVAGGSEYFVRFSDTGWIEVAVVGTDVYSDLAVLEIESLPVDVTPLEFVTREPTVGTRVVAIGNPFGLSGSVSAGIISGVDRTLQGANNFSIADAVQTDAPVNPGNSGGPLVTLDGGVVGVINAGGGDNVAFAISAALTQRVVPALITSGSYEHSYMGVALRSVTPRIAEANDLRPASGVYIDRVVDGGPSEGVLQGSDGEETLTGTAVPVGGDVIRRLDETRTATRQTLARFLALETSPGDTIDVVVERDGTEETVALTLGTRPSP